MSFANPLPWWALVAVIGIAATVSWLAYDRRTLSPQRRGVLVALRFATLLALVLFLMRPVARTSDAGDRDTIVPILVDTSRSMSLEDGAGGGRRIDQARQIVTDRLLPQLGSRFQVEVLSFGEVLAQATPSQLTAAARRSDLEGAFAGVRDRYRGKPVAGIVLLSDGGDTSGGGERAAEGAPPVYAVGIGSSAFGKDREVLSVTTAETVLDDSRVDLAVSAVSHGLGTAPIELRLIENGRQVDVKRAVPAADGTPIQEIFHVSPRRGAPSVYTVEIPAVQGELVPENNARSALVQPPTRARRILLVEGAPGFEHSFLKRTWSSDSGLEVDAVVKKGKNEQGADTFYIQAAQSRSDSLTSGYPATTEALFQYDALVLANVEGYQLTRAQLDATHAFVGRRGGGLLVLGARSFSRQGLGDTPLEALLPLDFNDRATEADVLPASTGRGANRVSLTASGEAHPVMQLTPDATDTRQRWESVPALASIAQLGAPRPGASVLAVASGPGGSARPLIAVQRFGEGRTMIFAGEASWRWRMLLPASDRSYETFWKQAIRWLSLPAGDPIAVSAAPGAMPGDTLPIRAIVRDEKFEPQRDVAVDVRVTSPDGRMESLRAAPENPSAADGRYVANFRAAQAGVFRIAAEARRGTATLGVSAASVLIGGADAEMTDPRLNLQLLTRLASSSGGRVLTVDQLAGLPDMLKASVPAAVLAVRRDLWHTGWSFGAILVLLGAEWILRRAWGLQ